MSDQRLRVLHVVSNLFHGGAQRMAVQLVCGFDRQTHDVALVSLFDEGDTDLLPILQAADVPAHFLGKRYGLDLRMFPRLRRILHQFRPDVLHIHHNLMRYALPVVMTCRVPVRVQTVHNLAQKDADGVDALMKRVAYPRWFVPVSIADSVTESLRQMYGLTDIPVIPNGIRVASYETAQVPRPQWRRDNDLPQEAFIFLTVGRLNRQKNHPLLLDAFAALARDHPDAYLLIIGEGDQRAATEARIAEHGLNARVRLMGTREDIPDALHAADAFVLSSDWEGNPLSVMEAMAAGCPTLCTAVGGVPQLIRDGDDGLLVPPGEVTALTDAMRCLLTDPDLRQRLGAHAADSARQQFDVSTMAHAYEHLYRSLLPDFE